MKTCRICEAFPATSGFRGEGRLYCAACMSVAKRSVKRMVRPKKNKLYASREWLALRFRAFELLGRKCLSCGDAPPNTVLHVDHIKPVSKYPELSLELSNLQILCRSCNFGKSNRFSTDLRPK